MWRKISALVMASQKWSKPLASWLIEALELLGFDQMTPVQAAAIPLLCKNSDLVVEAVTGSGKTLAYLTPLLTRLESANLYRKGMQAIIVEPTRELAHQVYKVFNELVDLAPEDKKPLFKAQLVVGSDLKSKMEDQQTYLQTLPSVIVATPGRLLDLLTTKHVSAKHLDLLVFDEGDKLLDINSTQAIKEILSLLPKQKRCALFSATMNTDLLSDIVLMGMRNPVKLSINDHSKSKIPETLSINQYTLEPAEKYAAALHLLKTTEFRKAIVYVPTCILVTHLYPIYKQELEFDVYSLHGKLQTTPRLKTLGKFESSINKCVLFTTDVAARGLDIPEVDFVLQIDPPTDPNFFVHRAGRTARAGQTGTCALFLTTGIEQGYVDFLSVKGVKMNSNLKLKVDLDNWISKVQEYSLSDKQNHDLAIRSFLSYVRWYMKHTASSIFRSELLNLVEIAKSLGVLRMPRMPELKGKDGEGQWFVPEFDIAGWKYKDPKKQAKMELQKPKPRVMKQTKAWSQKIERKETASQRREKKLKRQMHKHDDSSSEDEQDWKELISERKRSKHAADFSGL